MFKYKSILVTGGTGTYGRKLVDELMKRGDMERIVVFSRDEHKQNEMRLQYPDPTRSPIRYFIGDVRDKDRLYRAFKDIEVVVHAAALKQVPACEYNPFEAILTNVIGAKNVIDAAIDQGVRRVLAVSTDKAVNPISLYGATKLCEEKLMVQGNAYAGGRDTLFACVRFGNILQSRGSVIPLFRKQRETGKITVTDRDMTRYWITPRECAEFSLRCVEEMDGGEVFIPKIPSMKVTDLVKVVAPDAKIEEVGIRSGEKLHEDLLSEAESRYTLEYDDKFVIQADRRGREAEAKKGGNPLPAGFSYTSEQNDRWLTTDELKKILESDEF